MFGKSKSILYKVLYFIAAIGKISIFLLLYRKNDKKYYSFRSSYAFFIQYLDEYRHLRYLKNFVQKESTAIDIGASFGIYTARLSKLCHKGQIHAIEPLPQVFECLQKRFAHIQNIILYNVAITSKQTACAMVVPKLYGILPEPSLAYVINDRPNQNSSVIKFTVACKRLDDITIGLKNVAFIKIDIEGGEYDALSGANKTILAFRPILQIEENNIVEHSDKLLSLAEDLKYGVFYLTNLSKIKRLDLNNLPLERNFYLIPLEKMNNYIV